MSLGNYAELKVAAQKWSHRNDTQEIVEDAITLCESEIYGNMGALLKVRELETRATATADTSSRYIALPDNYLSMRRLQINATSTTDIRQRTPEALKIRSGSGLPRYFATTSQLEFDITPDSAYTLEMLYYKRPAALSAAADTNDILTNYPNIYLYGTVWAVFKYSGEEDKATEWYGSFLGAIRGANKQDRRGRFSSGASAAIEGLTP